jgi:hypothetical protein
MTLINRRNALFGTIGQIASVGTLALFGHGLTIDLAEAAPKKAAGARGKTVERWMNGWMSPRPGFSSARRMPVGPLHVSRFREPMYFLTRQIGWKPNDNQTKKLEAVEVPVGFVTDFASIPQVFWSILRPDGEYTYPAIIHDYLYWTQTRPREEADEIFRFGMQDFEIPAWKVNTIYQAVRAAGGVAWDGNARLKGQGEKRVLKVFPEDPRTRWRDWKARPDVFA